MQSPKQLRPIPNDANTIDMGQASCGLLLIFLIQTQTQNVAGQPQAHLSLRAPAAYSDFKFGRQIPLTSDRK